MDKERIDSMRTLTCGIFVFLLSLAGFSMNDAAQAGIFSFDGKPLVTIAENTYSTDDFKDWWGKWREKGMEIPETPDPYVDWLLFVREAENMALDEDYGYKHDINVYLKVLSLVKLKNEEVDSKIDYSTENLRAFYDQYFAPVRLIDIIIYKDLSAAEKTYDELHSGALTIDELVRISNELPTQDQTLNFHGAEIIQMDDLSESSNKKQSLMNVNEDVRKRPYNTETEWLEALSSIKKGEFYPPIAWQGGYVILHLKDVLEGDDADFTNNQSQIKTKYRKQQESILTGKLIEHLKEKFAVTVDQDRIDKMDIDGQNDVYSNEPVIRFSTMEISEKEVMDKIQKTHAFNKQYGFDAGEEDRFINGIVNGIINHTLITLESLDRHYEQQSPERELYGFYRKHKLVAGMNQHIRKQLPDITDDELKAYYQEHLAEFTSPHVYRMAIIEGQEEDLLKKIWLEVMVNGKDTMTAANEHLGYKPQIIGYPTNHLSPKIKGMAENLAEGDLSRVFAEGDGFAMVYLVESIASKTPELDEVREMITNRLNKQRFATARDEYLSALRNKYPVEINQHVWSTLREQLIHEYEN